MNTAKFGVVSVFVSMADGSVCKVTKLLTQGGDNTKLRKSDGAESGYITYGLSLAPNKLSGYQVCPHASAGCIKSCIYTSGMGGVFRNIPRSRIAKTRLFFQNRELFLSMLFKELYSARRKAKKLGKKLAVRLNVFSDLPWEKLCPELFWVFPDVQFYDYTKSFQRSMSHATDRAFPANYHLTFSRSETNGEEAKRVLLVGGNVAVVFDRASKGNLPETWSGFRVINGDATDLRFLDEQGVVIGLFAKGKGRRDTTGFVVPTVESSKGGRIALTIV
jgi:hypothetical protein